MAQMDQTQHALAEHIKSLNSAEAATWLVHEFPVSSLEYGRAFDLIKQRSWKKSEQLMLCRYYMQKVPFASPKPYETFASLMSLRAFLSILKEVYPKKKEDLQLFLYHLKPVLSRNISAATDKEEVELFLSSCEQ